ncbi:ChbG/HpnK family deacetylase [Mucilaginibacter terrenus]|uniref:ChbG/HpnK family deacetylase n=1 Tax=Mucilaginibacter terrenus TaxID=2482727 RepID=A0A3E2NXL1_9SPHI|nr:ChbG/HpnK family deacetylase [Mucilaginibacter terrenus]RFZ85755.1 ChbG/HpnK family deacetylase [Mucilaginibacter terrenus]
MQIPKNVLANADDFGYSSSVNKAILLCYERGIINSTSLMTNTEGFYDAVEKIHSNSAITNIGVHVDLAELRPITNIDPFFLNETGGWNISVTGSLMRYFSSAQKDALYKEIVAQVNRAIDQKIFITHIDSHLHLHTLPAFIGIFSQVAKEYRLKLRLAQTYRQGSFTKYLYRYIINQKLIRKELNYSDRFETIEYFLSKYPNSNIARKTELMLHPDLDANGNLVDHYDSNTMIRWLDFLGQPYTS